MTKTGTIILHDLRSAHNVGSIFRTADAAGVGKIFLVGTTPTPVDRFGRAQKDIAKTALGAENEVAWEYMNTFEQAVEKVRGEGGRLVAVEQDTRAIDYRMYHTEEPTTYVFGNEVDGLSHKVLSAVDAIVEIPMQGSKESLNVSVAVGVILFSLQ